jgi:hypothetical protein
VIKGFGNDKAWQSTRSNVRLHVPMIVRPIRDHRVECVDQVGGRHAMRSFDILSDAIQEGSNILLEGLMSSFPLGYLRTFCPWKSKPCSTRVPARGTRLVHQTCRS